MRLVHQNSLFCLILGLAVMGCEPAATPPLSDAALAATEEPATPAPPQLPEKTPDPIQELNTKLESMGAKVVAAPPDEKAASDAANYESLAQELAELRAEVKRLQETVDLTVSYVVGDLQEENRRLREEMARAYGAPSESSDGEHVAIHASSELLIAPEVAGADPAAGTAAAEYGEAGYLVVKEWGRSPEEVKSLGAQVPSLKGMICVAPPNLTDAEFSDLGRRIRDEFDAYDNIVIDVFTNEAAAQTYAERNIRSTVHNVLSIQKDGASGSDHILLNRNGVSVDVPR